MVTWDERSADKWTWTSGQFVLIDVDVLLVVIHVGAINDGAV